MAAADPLLTETGGRDATTGVIPGRYALSVGMPSKQAPQGWNWTPLSKVARLESGHTPSRKVPEYWGGDVPWIGIRDATANHGRTIYETLQYTNNLGIKNSSARILPANTVCLSRTASVGYVVVMGRPMATSQDFVNWVCSDELDYRFLKYVLLAEGDAVLQFASGTTHQTIYYPEAKAFHVCMPSPAEQSNIADVLQALDDKIELNRQMNETLESMARAIFKDWFVDFGPTRAKMDGRKPYLSSEIWSLFPARVEADGKPQGWETKPLLQLCELKRGYDLASQVRQHGNVPIISSSGPTGWHNEKMVNAPGIVTGRYGTIGQVFTCHVDFWPLNTTLYVRDFKGHPFWFVYHTLSGLDFAKYSDKAAVPGVNRNALHLERVIIPSADALESFDEAVAPLMSKVRANDAESDTLTALRDVLLPTLMSGEIRVKDAEKLVGEAT